MGFGQLEQRAGGNLAAQAAEEAEKLLRHAVSWLEKLAAKVPRSGWYRVVLGGAYQSLATCQFRTGQLDAGRRTYHRLVTNCEEIRTEFPGDANAAWWLNARAWFLALHGEGSKRGSDLAVKMAKRAVELSPDAGHIVNTLGVAYYRAGDWKAAIETLKKADQLSNGQHFGINAFVIAMAHWRLDDKEMAQKWYTDAQEWMKKQRPPDEELLQFRAEASTLLSMREKPTPTY